MTQNRGKSIEECKAEIEAELAWQKHVDGKALTVSRKRVTHLRNRIQRLNKEKS